MPEFRVNVRRFEEYTATAFIQAKSQEAAERKVQKILDKDGWDGVFDGDDGDYEECYSEVEPMKPKEKKESGCDGQ